MREMEVVRQNPAQDEYLKKLLKEANLTPKFITWEDTKVSGNSPLLLVVDQDHIDALIEVCDERDLKIVVAMNSRREFKIVSELKSQFDKIFGFIDLSQEVDYNTPLLKNYLNMNFSASAVSLDKLASDLDKIHEYTKSELTKIKDLHDRLVKVRVDTLKGIIVTSKFMAGEKSGGEFFDMLQTDQNFLYIQAGSDNYILSSMIISELEVLKLSSPTTSMKSQSENFEKMINHHANEMGANLSYCIINVDLQTLTAECQFKGDGFLYYQNELHDFSKSIKIKLKPSEKFFLLSNGALKNLKELNPKLSVKSFYSGNADKNTKDLINEFFFEVSRSKAGNFLIYDALMSVIEIEQKTLYKL
ncbi:MAG: hypothetical protein H7177_09075 [Rhizobacter sp.]|nr:hypothetical protein [Bacteriovorax sp.]